LKLTEVTSERDEGHNFRRFGEIFASLFSVISAVRYKMALYEKIALILISLWHSIQRLCLEYDFNICHMLWNRKTFCTVA